MCGIVGFITTETDRGAYDRRKFIESALIAGMVRGDDGTGLFTVPHEQKEDKTANWAKFGGNACDFMATEEYKKVFGTTVLLSTLRAVIGHNRSATVGKSSTSNSHPFQEGPITLVHNGTLAATYQMPKSQHQLGVEVDSHAICHNLATHPVEEVVGKLDGAFALVWHDARDDSINIVRNDERPLHLMPVACENTILIASEAEMLVWLAGRHNFKPGPCLQPEAGTWIKFTKEGNVPELKKLALYDPPRYGKAWKRGRGAWHGSGYGDDYPFTSTEGGDSGKAQSQRQEGATSGKARTLPVEAIRTLRDAGVDAARKYRMEVSAVIPVFGTTMCRVLGFLPEAGRPAEVRGLNYEAVRNAERQDEVWTVIPHMGIKTPQGAWTVLAKMESRTWEPPYSPIASDKSSTSYMPGPNNTYIPMSEWRLLTADGCGYCGTKLSPPQAHSLSWEGDFPVCASCRAELDSTSKEAGLATGPDLTESELDEIRRLGGI